MLTNNISLTVKQWLRPLVVVLLIGILASTAASTAVADDGPMVRKDIADTPDLESDHAQLSMMQFYVPATRANGAPVGSTYDNNPPASGQLEYYADRDGDNQPDELLFTRGFAKPLVVTYQDEHPTYAPYYDVLTGEEVEVRIARDTFAAISLDDGETWKETNLSESADKSSFDVEIDGQLVPYPGDVTEIVHAVAGNQILVAWTSKYCSQGSPRYSLKDFNGDGYADNPSDYPDDAPYELLFEDMYQVAGNQGSIDYTEWMHHGQYPFAHIGEIPFSCVWTARGTIESLPAGQGSDLEGQDVWGVRWRKAERLTSGRRDAFKLAIDGVEGAGFALSWQEDPEGLRPGYGEGPGVGWSGATVNHKADIWYSYIDFDEFTLVEDPLTPGVPAVDPDLLDTGKPQVFETMAMPVRVTDNEKCELVNGLPKTNADGEITMPWCYDLDIGNGTRAGMGTPDGTGDLCPVSWSDQNSDGLRQPTEYTVVDTNRIIPWTNSKGITMDICISDDGRMLNGQTGASRARLMMEGYTNALGEKSAWVVLMYEESKGLGAGHEPEAVALDIGKDAMYHTFDMFMPNQVASGHMLNMPEVASQRTLELLAAEPLPGTLGPTAVGEMWLIPSDLSIALAGGDEIAATPNQYATSIARRGSFMLQPSARIMERVDAGTATGMTSGIFLYKQGADRQGGPADIFMRRTVLPAGFNPATDNPFAVENLVCEGYNALTTSVNGWETYPETSYPYGLCIDDGAANLSSVTPLAAESLANDPDASHGINHRILQWGQYQDEYAADPYLLDPWSTPVAAARDNRYDEDWSNPFDVGKGHRGFIDGDYIMVMYGWSPNWLATSKGHEPYNLYIRRSFDGGLTWTTTPAEAPYYGDGTTYDQLNGVGDRVWLETRTLAAGQNEPARNVSQLTSNKETILDPRYSPTNIGTQSDVNRILNIDGTYTLLAIGDPLYDLRDPSKFIAVYETGDATVVLTLGEADPWDLYGSRATEWGDEWASEDIFAQGQGVWEERWDWVENKDETLAGESSVAMSPDGQFAWVVWNEWIQHETDINGDGLEDVTGADPMFRRLWWDVPVTLVADAGTYTALENEFVTLLGAADYDGDITTLTYSWDLDSDGIFETTGQNIDVQASGSTQGVALRVCNGAGMCDVDQGWINANHHAPRVWQMAVPGGPMPVGTLVDASARFTDPGRLDLHTAVWDWGDGTTSAGLITEDTNGRSSVTGSHTYTEAGVYPVKVTVTDISGNAGWDIFRYVVVYDPSAGFVTGGGWFDSPSGAYTPDDPTDPDVIGRATFAFVAKYQKNAPVPTGSTSFNFNAAGLRFHSEAYEWLVINQGGANAQFKGEGTINDSLAQNGQPYKFMLWATDGTPDTFRIKIWWESGGQEIVVYDNGSSQPIGGGSIVVHTR